MEIVSGRAGVGRRGKSERQRLRRADIPKVGARSAFVLAGGGGHGGVSLSNGERRRSLPVR